MTARPAADRGELRGAGWYEREHSSYGIPFPAVGERFDRLEEQPAVITGLWRTPVGESFSHRGDHHRLVDAPALPKPVQVPGRPIIVGGRGAKRTPAPAAQYADELNMPFKSVAETAQAYQRVAEACDRTGRAEAGRPPLVLSAGVVVAIGRTDAEAQRRAAPLHVKSALPLEDPVVGSPARLVGRLDESAAIGASRPHLRLTDLTDLDHLELLANEVLPQLSTDRGRPGHREALPCS